MMEVFDQSPHKVGRPCENEDGTGDTIGKWDAGTIGEDWWRPSVKALARSGDLARTRTNKKAGLKCAIRPTKRYDSTK